MAFYKVKKQILLQIILCLIHQFGNCQMNEELNGLILNDGGYFQVENGPLIMPYNGFNQFFEDYNNSRPWLEKELKPIHFLFGLDVGSGIYIDDHWITEASIFGYWAQNLAKGASPEIGVADSRKFRMSILGVGFDLFYRKKKDAVFLFGGGCQLQRWNLRSFATYYEDYHYIQFNVGLGPKIQYTPKIANRHLALEVGCIISGIPFSFDKINTPFDLPQNGQAFPFTCFTKINFRIF